MEEDRRHQAPDFSGTNFGKCRPKVDRKIELGDHRSQCWHVREQRHDHGYTDEQACHRNRRQTPPLKYLCTYIDILRAIYWRAVLEETPGHTGLTLLGDIKPRVVWHGQKCFQLLAGGGNALLIKHPHVMPRLLERAQFSLDVLRGQKKHKTFCLFLPSDRADVSHVVDSRRAYSRQSQDSLRRLSHPPPRALRVALPSMYGLPSLAVACGTTPLTYCK